MLGEASALRVRLHETSAVISRLTFLAMAITSSRYAPYIVCRISGYG